MTFLPSWGKPKDALAAKREAESKEVKRKKALDRAKIQRVDNVVLVTKQIDKVSN